mmetsp:Transcript_9124/g.11410  ORF Transcript_9124/g.11410 Transcript_9124/m.11410 type:complete len:337 (+) Transcript_9124:169-1179(+)
MSSITLFFTGMGMGVVHVLTGPDHLSALATLSANIGSFEAFWYGVRWGIGHSIGLLVVGSIFIALDLKNRGGNQNDDTTIIVPGNVQSFFESLVGVFMIVLGGYGFISSHKRYRGIESRNESSDMVDDYDEGEGGSVHVLPSTELSPSADGDGQQQTSFLPSLDVQHGEASMSIADVSYDAMGTTVPQIQNRNTADFIHDHHDHHHYHDCCKEDEECCCDCCGCCGESEISKPLLSLGIGIIHGVAGPGGVLGVIPAVELHNMKLAMIYLGTFCLSSTLTMGTFAASYGSCSSYITQRGSATVGYRMEMFSSSLSLFVGVLWLYLLSIGKLDDIFP